LTQDTLLLPHYSITNHPDNTFFGYHTPNQ